MVRRSELWDIWDPQDDQVIARGDDDDDDDGDDVDADDEASWCPNFLQEEEEEEDDDDADLDAWLLEDAWMRQACSSSVSDLSLELAEFSLWPAPSMTSDTAESEATTDRVNSVFGSIPMVSHENL